MEKKITRSFIWKQLASISVEELCTEQEALDEKTTIKYLPWMKAHELMMENFPEYRWEFSEDPQGRECHYFNDGSAEVRCRMTVEGHTNITYLPVHRQGKAILNPNAMQINSAKQRARVKALGEFGLGYTMWLNAADPPSFRAETVAEPSNDDQVEVIWLSALAELKEAKNQDAGKRIFRRFTQGLENRGLTDPTPKRWASICKEKGWRVVK